MVLRIFHRFLGLARRAKSLRFAAIRQRVLSGASGVLHVGAHHGQEAARYADHNLPVIWVEGDPGTFAVLRDRLQNFPKQTARLHLLGSANVKAVDFFIASNEGGSSSIYPFAEDAFPGKSNLQMIRTTQLPMARLDSVFPESEICGLSHWVLDVQGAELEVLVGAGRYFSSCQSLEIEVSLREVYKGGVQFSELDSWLKKQGFVALWDPPPNSHWEHFYFRARLSPKDSSMVPI